MAFRPDLYQQPILRKPDGAGSIDRDGSEPAAGARGSATSVQDIAASGVADASDSLPHRDAIQAMFGRHDISGLAASRGSDAETARTQLGARAYTMGNSIALGTTGDLHTVAHEAAHAVQQRHGAVPGGMGQAGDAHEQHADAVADRVVQGRSAEDLLDEYASSSGSSAGTGQAVQLKGGQKERAEQASELSAEIKEALDEAREYEKIWEGEDVKVARELRRRQAVIGQFTNPGAKPTSNQVEKFVEATTGIYQILRDFRIQLSQSFIAAAGQKMFAVDAEYEKVQERERERPKRGGGRGKRNAAKDSNKPVRPAYQACHQQFGELQGMGLYVLHDLDRKLDRVIEDFHGVVQTYHEKCDAFEATLASSTPEAEEATGPPEGSQLWLDDQVRNQGASIVLPGAPDRQRYTTSYDDALRGQYSREYDIQGATAETDYVLHIHWGGDGAFRHGKVKAFSERFMAGAGRSAWAQILRNLSVPLQGPETLS